MAPWLILFVGAIYLVISVELGVKGNFGMALVFWAYALSTVGLYVVAK
jgi:hypothetical protein